MLDDDEADQLLAKSTKPQAIHGNERIIASSGDRQFDQALAQTLSRLTDTFHVLPGFAYYDDTGSPNAYATKRTWLARADGTVFFGREYLAKARAQPEAPEVVVASTCAHEYGHILQYKMNLRPVLTAGQPNTKRLELHADFLAGYFAGLSKLRKRDYPAAVFATDHFESGDFNFRSPTHHGTPTQRAASVVRGFEVAYRERHALAEAVQIGIRYVSTQ